MSRQAEANRCNALASTGPKTAEGKATSSRNALRHGLASVLAVVEGLERAEDWEAHRDGIVAGLAPVGALEVTFAERVALCAWRLRRVARYETAMIAVGQENLAERFQRKDRPVKPSPLVRGLEDEAEGGSPEDALGHVLHRLEQKR